MSEASPQRGDDRKLTRKERELQFRMTIVLDAAEEVFADSSYAQASVEDIAQRAEISVGTLYNLFRSKEDIYKAVVSRTIADFMDRIVERVNDARGPRDKARAAVSYYFEHFQRYSRQMRLYASASNGFQWDLKSQLAHDALDRQVRFLKKLTDLCQQGLDEGIFKKGVPADLIAINLVGIPHAFLMAWLDRGEGDLVDMLPHALTLADRIMGVDVD